MSRAGFAACLRPPVKLKVHKAMLVTVIIGNYNYGRFITRAIDSVLAQSYGQFELIVVDDGSTDNSRELIDTYGDRIIKVYKENGGHADALNVGFKRSRGQLICMLDSDDFYHPTKLERTVSLFEEHPDFQFFFHRLETVDVNESLIGAEPDCAKSQIVDFRGKARFFRAPPTTGTTYRRVVLERIMPIPSAVTQGADNFLKFTCMSLFVGYYAAETLGALRLHGANHGSMGMPLNKRAIHDACIAVGIRDRLPSLTKISDRLMAITLARFLIDRPQDFRLKGMLDDYLSTSSFLSNLKVHILGYALFIKRIMSRKTIQ
jgi:glycosyltransferase involved in cell wall biosynthesis